MVVKGNYGRTGGAETLLAALLRHLDPKRLNPSLVKLTHDMDYRLPGLEDAAAYGITERNILWRNYGSAGPALREAREYVQSADIDVVYTHDMRADLLGYALNRTIGLPWLSHLHGWLGRTAHLKNRMHEWIDRRLLARADMVVVGSEQLRSSVERRCRCKTVRVVPNYVDPDSIAVDPTRVRAVREQLNVSGRQTLVGTVARLHRGKGHQVLLRAIAQIRRSDPTIRCVIVGEGGYRSALERLADDLQIADIVTFAGFRPDVTPYVAALDIFVTCSFTESLPVNVLEAMLLARPIVATDVGDVARVLDGGKAGVLLKPRRADETAQAIKQLLAQPQRRKQLAEEGRRRVLTHYSVARAAKQIEALLIATSRWQGAKTGRGLPC
jgi:glycosyltransferase involved in cell wall biosynthesis